MFVMGQLVYQMQIRYIIFKQHISRLNVIEFVLPLCHALCGWCVNISR
jgi:hypothetical protein